MQLILFKWCRKMRKYRRIIRKSDSKLQGYQYVLMALGFTIFISVLSSYIMKVSLDTPFQDMIPFFHSVKIGCFVCSFLLSLLFIFFNSRREKISKLKIKEMESSERKQAKKLLRLFNDKQITDVLKLSNTTRFGDEMPQIYLWLSYDFRYGYVAIENIANYDRMDREKYEQKVSGMFNGKYKKYAVVSSELTSGDSYMLFHFEDVQTSNRLYVDDNVHSLKQFISEDVHSIRLSKDLVWHSEQTPHLSIIARTRSGKSVLAGRYMARLMLMQDWTVEYNSAKYDRYVKEFSGKSTAIEIIERAEYWVNVMLSRLEEINVAEKEKYLDMENMKDIAIFFDEIGNLNAELELDKTLKKRWETSINKLTATGGSAGIHIIAISQFATKEGFLPSLARVNCSDGVIMLGGAADSADERRYLMSGFADLPKRSYRKGQGVTRIVSSGKKWETPHFYETPWFNE